MFQQPFQPKLNDIKELIIDNEIVSSGKLHTIRINAGKLPSDNRINVFAHVFHTGIPGPSLLVLGGVHGNEINGIEIVRRSLEEGMYASVVRGTVIIIPLLNVYGFINFSRDVADGKDVNRSFPGHLNGSLASRVARIITKKILPYCDVAVDFHTGGKALYNYPQVRFNKNDKVAELLAHQSGLAYLVEQPLIAHSFRKAANDMKVPAIVFEGGESIRLDNEVISSGIQSIKNMLITLQMIDTIAPAKDGEKWIIHKNSWLRAATPGIFLRHKTSGDFVFKGEKAGEIKDPYGTKSIDVISNVEGHIIGHNNASVVSLGEALFHVGYEYTKVQ